MAERGWPLEDGYRVDLFARQELVRGPDIVELWVTEAGLPADEAHRRLNEVLLVATHEGRGPVAVTTAYLRHDARLRMDLWHYRAFVAPAHRLSVLAITMAAIGRDVLRDRFVSGEDLRGAGVIFEVENPGLQRAHNQAIWPRLDFVFIGENARGDHVRLHPFPGALAPPPPAPAQGST